MFKIILVFSIFLSSFSIQAAYSQDFPLQPAEKEQAKEDSYKRRPQQKISVAQLETDALFIEAIKEVELGNLEPALTLLLQVIEKDSTYSAAYYEIASLYFVNGQPQLAIQANQKAVNIDPSNVWYLIQLAGTYQQLAQHKKASEIYEMLVEQNPSESEYYDEWAKSFLMINEGGKAVDVLNKWENRVGITEENSLKKQQIWLAIGEPNKAAKEIKKLAKAFPEEKKYKAILAEMYMQQKKYNKARKAYLEIKKADPYDKYVNISLAELYKKKKNPKKVYESLNDGFKNPFLEEDTKLQILVAFYSVEEFYKTYVDYTFDLVKTLVSLYPNNPRLLPIYGDMLYRKTQYSDALTVMQRSIQIDSSRYEAWEVLLFCELQADSGSLLKRDAARVFELFPSQAFPYYIYANHLASKHQYNEALEYYKKGVRWVLGNNELLVTFYSGMAECYHKLKQYAQSDEYMEKAIALTPDNYLVLNNYAYYLTEQNTNLAKAEKMSKKTIDAEPKNQTYLDTYAWVLYKSKRYKEALGYIEKASQPEKMSGGLVWEHRGDILYELNEKNKAKESWLKAEKLGGGSVELKYKINKINQELNSQK